MPAVSVVITSHDSGSMLERAVRSVIAQTSEDFEIVVVDDGSDVPRPEVAALDPRIRFFTQPNRGVSVARNVGVTLSSAPLVAFMDHDDEWHPAKLERQLALVSAHPDAAFWCTAFEWVDGDTVRMSDADPPTYHGLLRDQSVLLSSVIVRANRYWECGGHNPLLTQMEDWDLFLRLAMHDGAPSMAPEPLVRHHIHPASASRDYRAAEAARRSILREHARLARANSDEASLSAIAAGRARTRNLFAHKAIDECRALIRSDARGAVAAFAYAARREPRLAARSLVKGVSGRLRPRTR